MQLISVRYLGFLDTPQARLAAWHSLIIIVENLHRECTLERGIANDYIVRESYSSSGGIELI